MPQGIPLRINIAAHFLDRPASAHPQRIAIAGEGPAFTYAQLAELSQRAAGAFAASGARPGDRVLIVLPDSADFIAAFFGAARTGAIPVPVNPQSRQADFEHYLADTGAKIAVVHHAALAEFSRAVKVAPDCRVFLSGDAPNDEMSARIDRWIDALSSASLAAGVHGTSAGDAAFILYTSGSGGRPKGAVHAHKDMLVCAENHAQRVLGLRSDDVMFSVSKLFFAYGLGNGMYFPFSVGATTILDPERPRADRALEIVARNRPTVFFSVPTFYAALLAQAEKTHADFSSVRLAVSAGEPLPAEIFERFRSRFGIEILDGIGSTEMLHIFISSRPGRARPGSCGVPVPGYEAKIVDEAGAELSAGEIGNLLVRGESAFAEYWGIPELTARTKRSGWVLTGDKFLRDLDGYFHYCGRADDMMKVSGMWVSPGEVENALLGHPHVGEAAVVAEYDQDGLARPVAYVVLRASAIADVRSAHDLREFVRAKLAGYKCPHEIRFISELPKTATGKIQRFLLRDRARDAGRAAES